MADKYVDNIIISTLSKYKCYRQGSAPNELPNLFITFWENESNDSRHYDNEPIATIHNFDINVYGKKIGDVYDTLDECIDLLKGVGFLITGRGHDVPSDNINYRSRGIEATYYNKRERSQ